MLTADENDLLTLVGPGTPCGELFRRYWQPVGMPPELTDESPTKFVRVLGEDLVLYRDRCGRVGLLADRCSHRGASLLYGRVEERGIACAYHGWLYDAEGNCLETPAERARSADSEPSVGGALGADSLFHLTVKHRAYPVREHNGLYWAYLGPPPAPLLPRFDLTEVGPVKAVSETPRLDCNWLQNMENAVDQAHVFILHQNTRAFDADTGKNTTRGAIDDLDRFEYDETRWGIRRRLVHKSGYDDSDLIAFPAVQRIYNQYIVKVPIDDTHTREYHVYANLLSGERKGMERAGRALVTTASAWRKSVGNAAAGDAEHGWDGIRYYVELSSEAKNPADAVHPLARYRMDRLRFQDFTVMETQGPIAAREHEHLASSDRGVVLFRAMLNREIERVQQGLDPMGVARDGEDDLIDTFIYSYIDMLKHHPSTPHL